MGVVFAVLALLAISIKAMSMFDSKTPSAKPAEAVAVAAVETPVSDGKITEQQVAAIAVALALSEPKSAPMSSSISRAGATAGSWLQSGRMRGLGSSSSVRERRG